MKYWLILLSTYIGISSIAQKANLVLPSGHTREMTTAIFSPDEKKVLTASKDATAKLWDVNSGELLYTIDKHKDVVSSAKFSSDGKKILTASADSTAIIWNTQTAQPIHVLKDESSGIFSASFIANNTKVITIAINGIIRLWDVNSGKQIAASEKLPMSGVVYCSISNNEQFAVTTNSGKTAIVWNLNTLKFLYKLENPKATFTCITIAPDSKKIGAGFTDNAAIIWEANTGNIITEFKEHTSEIEAISFSQDSKKVATTSYDGKIRIWSAETAKAICTSKEKLGLASAIRFSPDGKTVATCSFSRAQLWNTETGELLKQLNGHIISVVSLAFTKDGKKLLTGSNDRTAKIWNTETGALDKNFRGKGLSVLCASYSPVGSKIVAGFEENSAKIWNLYTGEQTALLMGHKWRVISAAFSADGNKVVTGSIDSTARIYDAQTGKQLHVLNAHRGSVVVANFSPNGRKVVTGSYDNTAIVWNALTGSQLLILKAHAGSINGAVFSKDNQLIATVSNDKTIKVWNAENGQLISTLKGHTDILYDVQFSADKQKVISSSRDKSIKIWNLEKGEVEKTLQGHTHGVYHITFLEDDAGNKEDMILSASYDNTIKLWDVNSGSLMKTIELDANTFFKGFSPRSAHLIATSNTEIKVFDISNQSMKLQASISAMIGYTDYTMLLPNGYFKATLNAAKMLHYVTNDLKVITFDQLDVKYNRPDMVLKALGNQNHLLIKSYEKAYHKRIRKLAIDTLQFREGFSVPEVDYLNRDKISFVQSQDKLQLKIKASDNFYKLERFNIWVNEVPVFGLKGIKTVQKNNFDTTVIITLSQGENRIETSVVNINGAESFKMPLFVKYTPPKPIEEKQHFIGIGINQFANPDYNLSWSVKDIRDLALKLKTKYPNIIIDTLFDSDVTKENILALKQKLLQLNEDDKVIVSYSGHGVLSKDFDYYLSTYSINFNNPSEKGLVYDDLESLLDNIKPRKKLMLIDACHSGEVDKEEIAKIEASTKELNNNGVTTKSSIKVVTKKNLGMANSFELMQSLFVNVAKGTGATIISAAGGMQYAQERGDLKNGVFTYSLIEAFNQNQTLKVSELKKKVGERVTQLTNGLQKPTSRNETNNYDWVVW